MVAEPSVVIVGEPVVPDTTAGKGPENPLILFDLANAEILDLPILVTATTTP